jgi:hypothetical protein
MLLFAVDLLIAVTPVMLPSQKSTQTHAFNLTNYYFFKLDLFVLFICLSIK